MSQNTTQHPLNRHHSAPLQNSSSLPVNHSLLHPLLLTLTAILTVHLSLEAIVTITILIVYFIHQTTTVLLFFLSSILLLVTGVNIKVSASNQTPWKLKAHGYSSILCSMMLAFVIASLSNIYAQVSDDSDSKGIILGVSTLIFFLLIIRGVVGCITVKASSVLSELIQRREALRGVNEGVEFGGDIEVEGFDNFVDNNRGVLVDRAPHYLGTTITHSHNRERVMPSAPRAAVLDSSGIDAAERDIIASNDNTNDDFDELYALTLAIEEENEYILRAGRSRSRSNPVPLQRRKEFEDGSEVDTQRGVENRDKLNRLRHKHRTKLALKNEKNREPREGEDGSSPSLPRTVEDGPYCSICLESLQGSGNKNVMLACGHAFHKDCIQGWIVKEKSCPVCRYKLEG